MKRIEGLPPFLDCSGSLAVRVCGQIALVRCARFIARFSVLTGQLDWVVERTPPQFMSTVGRLPRYIGLFGETSLCANQEIVAELLATECGGMTVSARDVATGAPLWEHFVPAPSAAVWAEATPAWPGAQTEETRGFFANDPARLVICLSRHTRRSTVWGPKGTVDWLPPFACQTDAIRLDRTSGNRMWSATFPDVHVGIVERKAFSGLWAYRPRLGVIDFETGGNTVLQQLPHSLGWPVADGTGVAVSWRSNDHVGVERFDTRGNRVRTGAWPQERVTGTYLHSTEAGLALQTNAQGLTWLGDGTEPLWAVRAKPYIYRVHRVSDSDVFVGTDGNGGRLLAFDPNTGRETMNLKPTRSGVGHLTKLPGHNLLVSTFGVSRSHSVPARLLVLSMHDRQYTLEHECFLLLGTWEHGVVCRTGRRGEHIAVVDVRAPNSEGT